MTADAPAAPPSRGSLLDRGLRAIADVRPGEGLAALLLAVTLFLLLSSYYMLKTIRESFILTEGGAAVKTYSSAGQAILLLILVPAFAAFASRVNRMQLVKWVTLFFAANIVGFFLMAQAGAHLGVPFFLWVGIFNVMVISQYWAFANDLYTPEEGKRLFAIVGLGSNLGAWAGSTYAGHFIKALGPNLLMLVAAGLLVVCVAIAHLVNRRQQAPGKTDAGEKPLGRSGAFELIFKDRYLLLIAVLFVVLNIVNTTGEYLMGKLVVDESIARFGADASSLADRQKFVGAFYGDFFGNVNLLTFLVQALAVARIIKYFGVGGALFVHPILAFIGYASLLRWPALAVVRIVKLVDNTMDYSLGNTAKQALWLPTSREAKYKAKQAVDSFFMRAGDVLSAGVVFIGEHFALGLGAFAAINVALSAVWLVIAGGLAAENRKRTAALAEGGAES